MNESDIFKEINDILVKSVPDDFLIIKEKILKNENEKSKDSKWLISKWLRIAIVACLLLIAGGCVTVAANKLIGIDFFHLFYLNEASQNADSQVYMGFEQYKEISSNTSGYVVDTDVMSIEVTDAVTTGNAAVVILKVTAKQLDTTLINNGIVPQGNYSFNDTTGGSLVEDFQDASYRYYYSIDDEELLPNQFKILYMVIKKEPITVKHNTIELSKFGYFSDRGFITLYNKSWTIPINFDARTDSTKTIKIDKEILIDHKYITIKQMSITPFSCIIDIQGKIPEDSDFSNILSRLAKLNSELKVSFNNNTLLDNHSFVHSLLGSRADKEGNINQEGMVYYQLTIIFDKPILVNNVDAIYFNDEKYLLK